MILIGIEQLELYVSSDTPLKTFLIIRSIMDNYGELTKYVNQSTIMQVLEEPTVPMYADTGVRKSFLRNEYEKALESRLSYDCRRQCTGCGANRLIGGGACNA